MADGASAIVSGSSGSAQVSDEIPFQDLCVLLEKISKVKGTDRKKQLFRTFLTQWREAHARLHPTDADTTADTFFPVLRLLLPQVDKARAAYGMKETVLAKYYIEVLNIAKDSLDAKKLLNYRAPASAKQEAGDFAMVAYFVLRNRCPDRGKLTIAQVNEFLGDLAMSHTKKDRPGMKKALQLLLRNTSALEQKWLIRIILKEMKIGISENSFFSVFHADASDLFNVCSNLEKVCADLRDPSIHLNETSVSYFTPFRPMLGERAAMDKILSLMNHQPFYIETKFDGDRMQLHKQGNQYRYFSRSSKDYTSAFGATQYEGSFSPKIHDAFNRKVDSCIIDGEMVGWDTETNTFLPKGDNVDVKSITDRSSGVQQCFVVFDVLMINDTNFANQPLMDRVEQLKKVFSPVVGTIHLVDRQEASTKEEVVAALNVAIDNREEGLLLKKPTSTYQPDKRKGSGWLKIKPEYVDSLSDQLDVVIVGGYFGQGHRSGMVSHFMCAVAVPEETAGKRPSVFHSFCKVGTGYTMSELKDLGLKLKPYWKKFDTKRPPECVLLAKGFKEKPDLWIEPWNSQIVQIRAAEIVVSDKYKCGCTLRFPRVEKVRADKEWYDCMNLDELEQLKQMASGKLFHQQTADMESLPPSKKRKLASAIERPRGVASQFRQTDVSDVSATSKMFEGKEFCVVNGTRGLSKADAERKIAEHGGAFVQTPGPETFCVLVQKLIVRATSIISTGLYDVVKMDWLVKCLAEKQCLPFVPSLMIHTAPSTTATFADSYDKYGDSYTEEVTEETLKDIFKKIQEQHPDDVQVSREEIALMEERYFVDCNDRGLFRRYKFYLDMYTEIGNTNTAIPCCSLELAGLEIKFHGGQVVAEFDETITHIVFDQRDLSRVPEFRHLEREHSRKHHFVKSDWVKESIACKFVKNERPYEPITS